MLPYFRTWAAIDATPTGRSGPCWKPLSEPSLPASRAPRLTASAPLLSVASVVLLDRSPLNRNRIGPEHGRLRPCERQSGFLHDLGERSETTADLRDRQTVARRCCPWLSGGARPQRGPAGIVGDPAAARCTCRSEPVLYPRIVFAAATLSGPARKFVRGPERTSGLRSCQVRVISCRQQRHESQLPAWDAATLASRPHRS